VGIVLATTGVSAATLQATTLQATTLQTTTLQTATWLAVAVVAGIWISTLEAFRTRGARIVGVGSAEYRLVINATIFAFGLLAMAFLLLDAGFARAFFVTSFPLGLGSLVFSRWLWRRWLLRQRKFGHYLSRAIVVGTIDDVRYVTTQIENKSGAAYLVVGVALAEGPGGSVQVQDRSIPVVADFSTVAAAAAARGVDTVIVAGQPAERNDYVRSLGWQLEGTAAELVLSSRLTDVAGPRIHFRPVDGLPLIHVEIPQFDGAKHVIKRALDVVVSGALLLVLVIPFAALTVAIRLTSAGPALFRQIRVGQGGETFSILKFRSMVNDAEDRLSLLQGQNEGSGLLFKLTDDPRVTPLGRFMRRHSIDELPQLWNVLTGQMSLVGPRPPLPVEVQSYEQHVHRRLYIKPGLTGMWQVNGRSNLSWDESVRLDLYYVENWSLAGDLIILWRTVRVVFAPVGAY
jgi:exopolysaccharide biosynthesis polyprenyl glycosylphosphotransferase